MKKEPKTFHITKIDPPKIETRKHLSRVKIKLLIATLIVVFAGTFALLIKEYIDTHTFKFQSPILFQKPVIIERLKIISPLSRSGIALAKEVKNPYDPRSPKGIAWEMVKAKWDISQWGAFEELITRESNFNPYAVNSSSGAKGMFQSLGHADYTCEGWEFECQIRWGLNYIENRYNTPNQALRFHNLNNYY